MEYPHTIAALRSLGRTRDEQAAAMGYQKANSVILFEKRLPRLLAQLANAPGGADILRGLLRDIDTMHDVVYNTSVVSDHAASDASASGDIER
jgi:ribosomal protein L15E